MKPRFYFATCQVGAEKAVKGEVLGIHPRLKFAFSRPGFVTFKEDDDSKPALSLDKGIFTRLWGTVLGQAKDSAGLESLLGSIPKGSIVHCFDRDEAVPGDELPGFVRNGHIAAIMKDMTGLAIQGIPSVGGDVYDVIWVDDFHVFLGRHTHSARLVPMPGNVASLALAEKSPSRAYLKIEEAIYRFKPAVKRDLRVLEVGCSPGGATTAMLDRGMMVTGVDPQPLDTSVSSRPGSHLIRKPARFVTAEDLKVVNPDWLVMDMSIAPQEALDELAHVVSVLKSVWGEKLNLKTGFLTIKLNDWHFASYVPKYLARIEKIGFHDARPIQLSSNRQEFFVYSPRFG